MQLPPSFEDQVAADKTRLEKHRLHVSRLVGKRTNCSENSGSWRRHRTLATGFRRRSLNRLISA